MCGVVWCGVAVCCVVLCGVSKSVGAIGKEYRRRGRDKNVDVRETKGRWRRPEGEREGRGEERGIQVESLIIGSRLREKTI